MVRIITGTLVRAGRGELDPAAIPGILAARHRPDAGPTAPPHGLFLVEVRYEGRGAG
jgi:tRNA pseudouridine38-40 synthase